MPIEPAFLEHCRQTMTHYIGPVARQQICEILRQFPSLTHRQLVDQLAACIPDPQQAEEFWQRVLTRSDFPELMTASQQATSQNGQGKPIITPSPAEQSTVANHDSPSKLPLKLIYRGVSY